MTAVLHERLVTLRCGCGKDSTLTPRMFARHQANGTIWRCSSCRRKTLSATGNRYANFWLDRYSLEWVRETARMIWDDL